MSPTIFDVITLRNWNAVRSFLYVLVPVVLAALNVSHNELWIGLVLAVLAPTISAINTASGFRTWFYGVLAAGQALLLGLNLLTDAQISPWIPVVGAVIGGTMANTHLTEVPGKHAKPEK